MNKIGDKVQMQGYKDYQAANQLLSSVPTNEDFNPYDYIDQSYYKNNARGRMAYQEDLAKLLYLAQINQEERMNEYNSPIEQVERMRAAGLNPDLNGVTNEPAVNVAGYQGNPMDGTQSTLQNFSDVFGIINSVVSMVSGIIGLGSSIFNPANAVGLADSAMNLFQSAPSGLDIKSFIDSSPIPRRTARRIKDFYNSYFESLPAQTKNKREQVEFSKATTDLLYQKYNPFSAMNFDGDLGSQEMEFAKVWQPLIDAQNDLLLNELKGKNSIALFNSSRYSADFGQTEQEFYKTKYELYKFLRGPINETLAKLKKLDNKYPWAVYARGAVSALFLNSLGGLE